MGSDLLRQAIYEFAAAMIFAGLFFWASKYHLVWLCIFLAVVVAPARYYRKKHSELDKRK
ncbi:hypothetical protein PH7735_03966 [Shimia thalassica]|uniref:Uncharacterized protein n=1 Tax=Shimia thalassica TaxID=1715693 RepID=A0A0P1IYV2_9RHOB|nr:hypothetical protein PH7735_03966 [Shimia thalassica]